MTVFKKFSWIKETGFAMMVSVWLFQKALRIMALFLERLVERRRLFTVYLWGKPLAPSECAGNSGRGQNSPVDKP
jgi:hypothetical protein